jgi:hypothetical protein
MVLALKFWVVLGRGFSGITYGMIGDFICGRVRVVVESRGGCSTVLAICDGIGFVVGRWVPVLAVSR